MHASSYRMNRTIHLFSVAVCVRTCAAEFAFILIILKASSARVFFSRKKIFCELRWKLRKNAYGHFRWAIYLEIEAWKRGHGWNEELSTSPPHNHRRCRHQCRRCLMKHSECSPLGHRLKYEQFHFLQVFILSLPARVAAVWFGPDQVSSACSIGVFGNQVSVCII